MIHVSEMYICEHKCKLECINRFQTAKFLNICSPHCLKFEQRVWQKMLKIKFPNKWHSLKSLSAYIFESKK